MMQGEKVAADIREAHENLSGDSAILPVAVGDLAPAAAAHAAGAGADRAERQGARRGDGGARDRHPGGRSRRSRACDFDPRELETLRGAPVRAARHGAQARDAGRRSAGARAANTPTNSPRSRRAKRASSRSRPRRAPPPPSTPAPPTRCQTPRAAAARALETAVNAELPALKLERARFAVALKRDDALASPDGYDRAEFTVQTNPGSRPGPLMKVASGGELARFLLALKVSLAERDTAPTLVFDEIDSGVGGAVADAIGQRLARLAAKAQVLAVTHAPQVAARSQPAFPDRQERRRQGRTRRDPGAGARRLGAARGDRPHARRRRDHRRGAAAAKSLIEKAG